MVEAVILEQHARVGVDVGVRILGLAMLGEHTGHNLVYGVDDLRDGARAWGGASQGTIAGVVSCMAA